MGKYLNQLQLCAAKRPSARETAQQRRRRNLIDRLQEQLELIRAEMAGVDYLKTRTVYTEDALGRPVIEQIKSPLKAWYWKSAEGAWYIGLRYRNTVIDLGKQRKAIRVGRKREIAGVIETLIAATENGELDAALKSAAERVDGGKRDRASAMAGKAAI